MSLLFGFRLCLSGRISLLDFGVRLVHFSFCPMLSSFTPLPLAFATIAFLVKEKLSAIGALLAAFVGSLIGTCLLYTSDAADE